MDQRWVGCVDHSFMRRSSDINVDYSAELQTPWKSLLSVSWSDASCGGLFVEWLVTVFLFLHSMWGAEKQNAEMLNCISNFAANLR